MKSETGFYNGLMNVDQACEYLGITKRLMDDLTGHKRVKYLLLGGRKFKRSWLDDYIEANAIPASE